MSFPGGSAVKNLPAMKETQETWNRSLDQDDPLEDGMEIHSSIFVWRIPWTEELSRLHTVHRISKSWTGLKRFEHTHTHI